MQLMHFNIHSFINQSVFICLPQNSSKSHLATLSKLSRSRPNSLINLPAHQTDFHSPPSLFLWKLNPCSPETVSNWTVIKQIVFLCILMTPVDFLPLVWKVGFIIDSVVSPEARVNNVTPSARFHLQNINLLTPNSSIIIHSLITSRIDRWDSFPSGLERLHELRLAQNSLSLVDLITPVHQQLHWLLLSIALIVRLCFSPSEPFNLE